MRKRVEERGREGGQERACRKAAADVCENVSLSDARAEREREGETKGQTCTEREREKERKTPTQADCKRPRQERAREIHR